ncbi:hypothetical protein SDC9_134954 [bioreactor metagenome]|uniref:Uncharacterized protein n=1 Tax=bioreactor metagenome TaxID=1076179 RepID=A0A645DEI3_9ZZZZ
MHRRLAAEQPKRQQVPDAPTFADGAKERFAAPDRTIPTVARAIPDKTDGGFQGSLFRQHGSKVRMMMLNRDHRHVQRMRKSC